MTFHRRNVPFSCGPKHSIDAEIHSLVLSGRNPGIYT